MFVHHSVALYKELSGAIDYYSGIVAEPPYTKNNNRSVCPSASSKLLLITVCSIDSDVS